MWTKENEEKLILLAKDNNISDIAKEMNISYDSVRKKLKRIGVRANNERTIDLTYIKENVASKERQKELEKTVDTLVKNLINREKELESILSVDNVRTHKIIEINKEMPSEATAIVLASDWHYEEPVKKSQVNGLNEFNRDIAKKRIEYFFRVLAKLINIHDKELKLDTLILALLGDFISGSIHEDLQEANPIQPTQAIWEVQNLIASGIEYLLANTSVRLVIPCSSGNHGRSTIKQRTSTEYGNSLEILMYNQLRQYFDGNNRVKFIINDAYLTYIDVYGFRLRFHHGHDIKYGGGIGGLFIPMYKAISQWDKADRADYSFCGHFHNLKSGGNFISNGSLIGYNAYAVKIKADFERPAQAFALLDKKRGITCIRNIILD